MMGKEMMEKQNMKTKQTNTQKNLETQLLLGELSDKLPSPCFAVVMRAAAGRQWGMGWFPFICGSDCFFSYLSEEEGMQFTEWGKRYFPI